MKHEDQAQHQRRKSPEVTLFESLELNPLLSVFVDETVKLLILFLSQFELKFLPLESRSIIYLKQQ